MNGKEFIEQNDLVPGTYQGQEGEIEISPLDLASFETIEFSLEETLALAGEKARSIPRLDLIDDEFIEKAADLGEVDLDAVKQEFTAGMVKGMEGRDVDAE